MTQIVPAEIVDPGVSEQLQPGRFHIGHALTILAGEGVASAAALFLPLLQRCQGLDVQRDMPRLCRLGAFGCDCDALRLQVHVMPAQVE
ncbi:hypothetical protein D3C80_1846590 [compost metagenome]